MSLLQKRINELEEEIFQWKAASGLVDGHGDPDGITPDDLRKVLSEAGCTIDKQQCPTHGHVHGQEAEELRKGLEEIIGDATGDVAEAGWLQRLLDETDARDSLAFLEAKDS